MTQITKDLYVIEFGREYSDFFISDLMWLCAYKPQRQPFELMPIGNYSIVGEVSRDISMFYYKGYSFKGFSDIEETLKSNGCTFTPYNKFVIFKLNN